MRSSDEYNDIGGGGLDAALQNAFDSHIVKSDEGTYEPMACPDGTINVDGACQPIEVINLECSPGYHREGNTCVPDITPNALLCPAGSINVNGVCVPQHHDCSCISGTPNIDANGNCGCEPSGGGGPVIITQLDCPKGWTNTGTKCIAPSVVTPVLGNQFADIEAKLKTFYTNNKGLSLAIVIGAAFLFLKK